jgi:hypothetical protein
MKKLPVSEALAVVCLLAPLWKVQSLLDTCWKARRERRCSLEEYSNKGSRKGTMFSLTNGA